MRVLLVEASKNQWEVYAKTPSKARFAYTYIYKILYSYTVPHTHVLLILCIKKNHVNQF